LIGKSSFLITRIIGQRLVSCHLCDNYRIQRISVPESHAMEPNLASSIDELIVLHAGVATTLLREFPKADGIWFNLDGEPAGALPKKNVPPGHVAEYGDAKFERRAAKLLRDTTPRLLEIVSSLGELGITLRDAFVSAKRFPMGGDKEGAMVTGAFTGGSGAVFARREMLAFNDRVLAVAPAEFHVVGIVEDASLVPAIQEAGKGGLISGLEHLINKGLLLNGKRRESGHFKNWAEAFSMFDEAPEGTYTTPVFRFVGESTHNLDILYVPHGDVARLDKGDGNVIAFDPVRGFDLNQTPLGPQRPLTF
jgi:hypothetical protein